MTGKRILIFIPWFRPAFKAGGPIRSIDTLIDNYCDGIEYFIVCSNKDVDGTLIDVVDCNCWTKYKNNTQIWYHSGNFTNLPFLKISNSVNPTFIMLVGVFSWTYNLYPLMVLPTEKLIWSVRGMLHPGALNQKRFKKKFVLGLLKHFSFIRKIRFHATDDFEETFIKKVFGGNMVVRKAVNFPFVHSYAEPKLKKEGSLNLLSVALISPMKNHLLVLRSLLRVKQEVVYDIVGAIKDKAYWKECLNIIKLLPSNIKVNYHGDQQPEALSQFYMNSHLMVMPSRSENFGHSIVECLSVGRPVITSVNTPWIDLQEHKAGVNVETTEYELTRNIDFFISMSQMEYDEYCIGARNYFNRQIDVAQIRIQYNNLFSN